MTTPRDVLDFWFKETPARARFRVDPALDEAIRARFGDAIVAAREGKLDDWMATGQGALALLILLDQFPRNVYRGHADAFASGAKAREVANAAITKGFDVEMPKEPRVFFYLPFEHSENLDDQERSVVLMRERIADDPSPESNYTYATMHRDVIRRFGRFPGRNEALRRESTPEEREFLTSPQRF